MMVIYMRKWRRKLIYENAHTRIILFSFKFDIREYKFFFLQHFLTIFPFQKRLSVGAKWQTHYWVSKLFTWLLKLPGRLRCPHQLSRCLWTSSQWYRLDGAGELSPCSCSTWYRKVSSVMPGGICRQKQILKNKNKAYYSPDNEQMS